MSTWHRLGTRLYGPSGRTTALSRIGEERLAIGGASGSGGSYAGSKTTRLTIVGSVELGSALVWPNWTTVTGGPV